MNKGAKRTLRKLIIAFGQVFNNIVIQRTNKTGGVTARIKVPLAYAPKEKFLVRLDQQANLNSREFATSLPRMGFEITGLAYDPSRKLTRVQKYSQVKTGEDGKKTNFNSLRKGKVVGEHEVKFSSGKEIITLNHEAFDRSLYSEGALSAAKWLMKKKPGLYSMRDLMNFK